MIPGERSLVARLAQKPFVLVGVNSDKSPEALRAAMEKEGITWRSFFDGGSTSGPIATAWNVKGWPTIYLIDEKGVIRRKGHDAPEKEVEALVEAAEKGVTTPSR